MLAGERTREYLTPDGEPRAVCDLCRTRVQRAGWVRAEGSEAPAEVPETRAEVPMAEVLDYAPDLRSISGGRADFEVEFDHYEEVPAHLASKVVTAAAPSAA